MHAKDKPNPDVKEPEGGRAGLPESENEAAAPACPACGGLMFEVRGKLQCSRCRVICETCCEGGRW